VQRKHLFGAGRSNKGLSGFIWVSAAKIET
jgi:hypothetical protein